MTDHRHYVYTMSQQFENMKKDIEGKHGTAISAALQRARTMLLRNAADVTVMLNSYKVLAADGNSD